MDEEDLLGCKSRFVIGHIIISIIYWIYSFIQVASIGGRGEKLALFFASMLVVLDLIVIITNAVKKKKLWFAIRIVELFIVTLALFDIRFTKISVIISLYFIMLTIEFILESDFTDFYSRNMVLLEVTLPSIFTMIVILFVDPGDEGVFFGKLCTFIAMISFIILISNLVVDIIISSDKKVFELRRFSETTRQANEELKIQQEKVKHANEELGVQKIKLETAYDKINSVNAETTIQNLILKYISSSIEIETLLKLITESILEAMGLDVCAVVIQPQIAGNDKIMYQIRTRMSQESLSLMSRKIEEGCLEQYIQAEETHIDNHVLPDSYSFLANSPIQSLLIIPLVRAHLIQGALVCGRSQYEFFHDNIQFFETVVAQLLVAIHNASLYAKMQQMAIRDSLTGIYNRGHLNLLIDQYSKEAVEKKTPLTVALFDIDRFKSINDTYGHLFGDIVIKNIAEIAQSIAIEYDGIAARYGGEEFVLVLPYKKIEESTKIVEQMRQKICDMRLTCESDTVMAKVSVGITSYPETCTHITELLNRADSAMYYSKESGRNMITIDSTQVQEFINKNVNSFRKE